ELNLAPTSARLRFRFSVSADSLCDYQIIAFQKDIAPGQPYEFSAPQPGEEVNGYQASLPILGRLDYALNFLFALRTDFPVLPGSVGVADSFDVTKDFQRRR